MRIIEILNMKNRICVVLCLLFMSLLCVGCGKKRSDSGVLLDVYHISGSIDSIVPVDIYVDVETYENQTKLLAALIEDLSTPVDKETYIAPLGAESGFCGYYSDDTQVSLDFSSEKYNYENVIKNVLTRAAITKTLTQVPGIKTVSFTLDGMSVVDSMGNPIGPLGADSFMDNEGAQINGDERTTLTLYFADENGSKLRKVNRNVTYSGNISMDKLVVEQLIIGPKDIENSYSTLNENTKIINVTTQDGTCYVNLDSAFLFPPGNVSNEVIIYSIVDSLIELGTINKVQILVDSESNILYRESIDLNTPLSRNLDIVE